MELTTKQPFCIQLLKDLQVCDSMCVYDQLCALKGETERTLKAEQASKVECVSQSAGQLRGLWQYYESRNRQGTQQIQQDITCTKVFTPLAPAIFFLQQMKLWWAVETNASNANPRILIFLTTLGSPSNDAREVEFSTLRIAQMQAQPKKESMSWLMVDIWLTTLSISFIFRFIRWINDNRKIVKHNITDITV